MTDTDTKRIKCALACCRRKTTDPRADGWLFQDDLHGLGLRNGWWCPDCTKELKAVLDGLVAAGKLEREPISRH